MSHRLLKEYGYFAPLLLVYVTIVLILSENSFAGDEARYVQFAKNLVQGFYSPADPNQLDLWNGPGYPLVLVPFVALGLPMLIAKLANACFLFFAVILIYRTLCIYIPHHQARYFSLLLGLYPPFMPHLPYLITEPFVVLLVSAFSFFLCRHAITKLNYTGHFFVAVIALTWLMLTKVIFGYVILIILVISAFRYILSRTISSKTCFVICCFAMLFCSPYLVYTYSLTNRIFYWSDAGGVTLYWISSPYPREFGDPHSSSGNIRGNPQENPELWKNHGAFFESISELSPLEKDDARKAQAIRNIIENPGKYTLNIFANIGRMFFSYPYSYAEDRLTTYFWAIPNMFIFVTMVFCVYPTWFGRKHIPGEILTLLLIGWTAFGASSMVSAYARQFYVLVPIFAIWIGFVLFGILNINIMPVRSPNSKLIMAKQTHHKTDEK